MDEKKSWPGRFSAVATYELGGGKVQGGRSPREVFRTRLKEVRRRRDLTQAQLADRLTDAGRPMSKTAIVRIENGDRDVSLDEALAFAAVLGVAPAHLLSPVDGEMLAPVEWIGLDTGAVRNWLLYANPLVEPQKDDEEDVLRARLRQQVERYALALADAYHGQDKAGMRDAGAAIIATVAEYEEARDDA